MQRYDRAAERAELAAEALDVIEEQTRAETPEE